MTIQEDHQQEEHDSDRDLISSPFSTGGAGVFFEQHVGAYWLAQLLILGIPPILVKTRVTEVHFQTEHLGWHTDDFLIECKSGNGSIQKLVGQVKRNFSISATNTECKKTIRDFWSDFSNSEQFGSNDRLVLTVLRGTNTLLQHFVGLLDCSRAARNGSEFESRLLKEGFISKKSVAYCHELCKIITEIEDRPKTPADIWSFLTIIHVLSLDLCSSTSQTEVHIKNLLSYSNSDTDPIELANKSWHDLIGIASNAMSEARSYRQIDLPEELRQRHHSIGVKEEQVIRALTEHTDLIIRGIRSTIGQHFHLERDTLIQRVLGELETSQIVIVSGPAGSGKSAIGKDVFSLMSKEHIAFGFRVEEFAQPHFDATLNAAQIPTNGANLNAILAAQGRYFVLIESVERLLERATRDAFSDFMTLVALMPNIRILITCRDYSIDLVRASFMQPIGIKYTIINIPSLNDDELNEIETAIPELSTPLRHEFLRNILRNPYFLDKANQISWESEQSFPKNEREFRILFWREIVRANHRYTAGVSQRRGEAFQKIAIRRSRALSPYVAYNDLDPEIVSTLRQDSLLSSPETNSLIIAPAHDVLEDWAVLQYLDERHLTGGGSFTDLSIEVGTNPSVRRSYRKWVAELEERDPIETDRLFQTVLTDIGFLLQFRDDTIVSILRAPQSPEFLLRHEEQLLSNDGEILKRVIHLLRVACLTTPKWLKFSNSYGSSFYVPEGQAWPIVLEIIQRNIERFSKEEGLLFLGLIEDFVRGISQENQYIIGSEYAASIGHWLLSFYSGYSSEKIYDRILKVLAKIPNADVTKYEEILRGKRHEDSRRDYLSEALRKIVYTGVEGIQTARDLPDVLISVAYEYLLESEQKIRPFQDHSRLDDIDSKFGINHSISQQFYPISAYQGPWLSLLRFHQSKGLDFIIDFFNICIKWYTTNTAPSHQDLYEIVMEFEDGTTLIQWGNSWFWNLYRGISVGPHIFQCILMAFERWLLEKAEINPDKLDDLLLGIIRRSNSVMLTSVVASAATSNPIYATKTLLVLLNSRDCILLDHLRKINEYRINNISDILPIQRSRDKLYNIERKQSNSLQHRNRHLEDAIFSLQFGSIKSQIQEIIDRHRSILAEKSIISPEDQHWQFSLLRMDVRNYELSVISNQNTNEDIINEKSESNDIIVFTPKNHITNHESESTSTKLSAIGLQMWALNTFRRELAIADETSTWSSKLKDVMSDNIQAEHYSLRSESGPGILAAVCIRDHWEEMMELEKEWCLERVCKEVRETAGEMDFLERYQRFDMAADRASASVLPLLLTMNLSPSQHEEVMQSFVSGLFHPVYEVREYFIWGLSEYLTGSNPSLIVSAINALSHEAILIESRILQEENKPYQYRQESHVIYSEVARLVKEEFLMPNKIDENVLEKLDINSRTGSEAIKYILLALSNFTESEIAINTYRRTIITIVKWWDSDVDQIGRRQYNHGNHQLESTLIQSIAKFTMRIPTENAKSLIEPIISAIDMHPEEVSWMLLNLYIEEDRNPNPAHFWALWQLFSNAAINSSWKQNLISDYPFGKEIISKLFLTEGWKETTRGWASLNGFEYLINHLYENMPPSSIILDSYLRFIYHIGGHLLPEAFILIAKSLEAGIPQLMLRKENTFLTLEMFLQRHVYGKPLALKQNIIIRDATLFILDVLIENGSSASYQMRDDFVTPIPSDLLV